MDDPESKDHVLCHPTPRRGPGAVRPDPHVHPVVGRAVLPNEQTPTSSGSNLHRPEDRRADGPGRGASVELNLSPYPIEEGEGVGPVHDHGSRHRVSITHYSTLCVIDHTVPH